jgi:hypothetical protein
MWERDIAGMKAIGIADDSSYEEMELAFAVVVPAADDLQPR